MPATAPYNLRAYDTPLTISRSYPLEADGAGRQRIESDRSINPEHLCTLAALTLLRTSEEEKLRVYCGSLDPEAAQLLDDLLDTAFAELSVKDATVLGIVNVLIECALDIHAHARAKDSSDRGEVR
jgi:hypothetical protein